MIEILAGARSAYEGGNLVSIAANELESAELQSVSAVLVKQLAALRIQAADCELRIREFEEQPPGLNKLNASRRE